jgi:hypothetical protein
MVSPARIKDLLRRRPCLVLDVGRTRDNTSLLYTLLAVTHFDKKSILEADIPEDKKKYALPIAPNSIDVHNRRPLQTNPPWADKHSYQVLVPTKVAPDRVLNRDGRQTILPEQELARIESFLNERGDVQVRHSAIQYATENSPMPIHITAGVAEDADSSATLEDDAAVLNKLIEGIVEARSAHECVPLRTTIKHALLP